MALHSFGKSALRVTKNYSKGYSHTQIKIRNATCNDPWPPSGKEMYELAQMTYDQSDFVEIMEIIDKRLNDKGKNWRHVFKALVVLDYLLHSGSENVIRYCEDNLYEIKTLREFQYIDDEDHDQGANVRHKAADITNLLMDEERLSRERLARAHMRDRLMGRSRNSYDTDSDDERPSGERYRRKPLPNGLDALTKGEEEDLRRAIEASKKSAADETRTAEDKDLERAIKLSQEDEERRRKLVEENAAALFNDSNQLPSPATQQTQALIDASLPLQYATGLQPQFTAVQPQYTSIQPQFTSYNPYFQAAQQEAMQAEYMRQQAEYAQMQAQQAAVSAGFFPQQLPQQQFFEPPPQRPLVPQTTSFGSNNPFLHTPGTSGPSSPAGLPARPAFDGPVSFNLPGTYEGREPPRSRSEVQRHESSTDAFLRPFSTGSEPPRRGREREDARLAALFANYTGDGVDTFGNIGQLRFGQTPFGRLAVQQTGAEPSHNPFLQSPEQSSQQRSQEENLINI